jgi:hypothetical protein
MANVISVRHSELTQTHAHTHTHTHTHSAFRSFTDTLKHKIRLPTGQQERCTAAKHYSNIVQYSEPRNITLGPLGRKAGSTSHLVQRSIMCCVGYNTTELALTRLLLVPAGLCD